MRKIIAAGCLMAAMTLCVGCSSAKDGSKDTTKATTETKMKVQSKYKVPKITAAKKTDQLADAQKGETIVTMKVKGYGEMQFKFFMKKAPLAVKNFVTLASNGYFDGQIFHRVINDFMIQSGDPTGTGTGGESIWGEDFDNDRIQHLHRSSDIRDIKIMEKRNIRVQICWMFFNSFLQFNQFFS